MLLANVRRTWSILSALLLMGMGLVVFVDRLSVHANTANTNAPGGDYIQPRLEPQPLTPGQGVDAQVTLDKAPNPSLRGVGRDRLHLYWDKPDNTDYPTLSDPHSGRDRWEWTADDPNSASANWQTIQHMGLEDSTGDGDLDRQYGQAEGLPTGTRYDV